MRKYLAIYRGIGVGINDVLAETPEAAAEQALDKYGMEPRDGDEILVVEAKTLRRFTVDVPDATITPQ